MFKSKIKEMFNYKRIYVSDEYLRVEVDEAQIQEALLATAKRNAELLEVDDYIKKGDLVTIKMESMLEWYNQKSIVLLVGAGMFHQQFENKLIGLKKNENQVIKFDGYIIKTKIIKIERQYVPLLTDEMAARSGVEGVDSVKKLREYLYAESLRRSRQESYRKTSNIVFEQLVKLSEFLIAETDLDLICRSEISRWITLLEIAGLDATELTPEQLELRIGCRSLEEFMQYNRSWYILMIKEMLLGKALAKMDRVAFTKRTYEDYIRRYALENGYKLEQARRLVAYEKYVMESYQRYGRERVYQYFLQQEERKTAQAM
ncbi:hypothetical protein [Azotosporobacter soli]|uniref:hypothetical protein n=1 Tax=Azotosporobacter soli TaxID=3055040 RepID=UPI0031FE8A15